MAEEMQEAEQTTEETTVEHGSFYGGLSDEARQDPSADKFMKADNDAAFKMYKDAQSAIGKDKVVLPNWTDETDVSRFYDALGVPNSPDKYEMGEYDWATEAGYKNEIMKSIAHQNNLTADQARGVEKMYLEDVRANMERSQKEAEEQKGAANQKLRTEMGDRFEEKMAMKDGVIDKFARTPEAAAALKALAESDPAVAASLADIGGKFSEHSIGEFTVKRESISPIAAQEEIDAMRGDMSSAFWDDSDRVAHKNAVDKMLRLEAIVAGS